MIFKFTATCLVEVECFAQFFFLPSAFIIESSTKQCSCRHHRLVDRRNVLRWTKPPVALKPAGDKPPMSVVPRPFCPMHSFHSISECQSLLSKIVWCILNNTGHSSYYSWLQSAKYRVAQKSDTARTYITLYERYHFFGPPGRSYLLCTLCHVASHIQRWRFHDNQMRWLKSEMFRIAN